MLELSFGELIPTGYVIYFSWLPQTPLSIITPYSLKKAKVIMEKRLIMRAMESTGGNKSKAALLLELSYPALLGKLKEYEI